MESFQKEIMNKFFDDFSMEILFDAFTFIE